MGDWQATNKTQGSIPCGVFDGVASSCMVAGFPGPFPMDQCLLRRVTIFLLLHLLFLEPGAGAFWLSRKFPHPCPEEASVRNFLLPDLSFLQGIKAGSRPSPRLWLSAPPRAHHTLFQAAAKQCHESGPGGRLIPGGTLGLRSKKKITGLGPPTERDSCHPWYSYLLGDSSIASQEARLGKTA